jgi:2-polyprenyl-6-methoxyphenol hydroxylase-like FAD-dependent oxidoreductase
MEGTFMACIKVLIVGAGLGGLTLAQSLRNSGIEVQIFERDKSPWDRPQGYRLHLDGDAINAAHEVLPPALRAVFDATSQPTKPFTTILKTDLSVVKQLPTDDDLGEGVWPHHEGEPVHFNVDRATLRQILLSGLEDAVKYGKKLVRYEQHENRVIAHFGDASTAEGHVLVGADGIRSAVRTQRAPYAGTVDAGVQAIYGRLAIQAAESLVPAEALEDIFTIASDERKVFLGLGSVLFPTPPDQAASQLAAGTRIRPQKDYVVCILGGRREFFPRGLKTATSDELQRCAAQMLKSWPAPASSVIRAGDASSFFLVEMYTSVPCSLDAPSNVTLLGDAIHAMTPTLGRGANVAMRDGALLARALKAVARGDIELSDALTAYEGNMLRYGFQVVREAAHIGQQRMAQNPLPT